MLLCCLQVISVACRLDPDLQLDSSRWQLNQAPSYHSELRVGGPEARRSGFYMCIAQAFRRADRTASAMCDLITTHLIPQSGGRSYKAAIMWPAVLADRAAKTASTGSIHHIMWSTWLACMTCFQLVGSAQTAASHGWRTHVQLHGSNIMYTGYNSPANTRKAEVPCYLCRLLRHAR
jgi:hypothetical protein